MQRSVEYTIPLATLSTPTKECLEGGPTGLPLLWTTRRKYSDNFLAVEPVELDLVQYLSNSLGVVILASWS